VKSTSDSRYKTPARKSSKAKKQGARPSRLPVSVSGQITLLTDFGTSDYYVGAVKGVILSINPAALVVDITHDVPAQDIEAAAFILVSCYRSFRRGTIHVVVVDPGVGSSRRPIVANADGHYLIGPDNGVFSYVLERESNQKIVHVTATEYFRQPMSTTFHGRDVFAPVAAALSKGVPLDLFGPEISDAVRLPSLEPKGTKDGKLTGRIIHIDHFGNCVTSFERAALSNEIGNGVRLRVKGKRIRSIRRFYGEEKADRGLFAIWGSAGFLEISARDRSAAELLKARRGDEVVVDID
jgi:S-adenosylmethionine hydrolase